jgi:hypothetical protein
MKLLIENISINTLATILGSTVQKSKALLGKLPKSYLVTFFTYGRFSFEKLAYLSQLFNLKEYEDEKQDR